MHTFKTKFKPGDMVVLIKNHPPCEIKEVAILLQRKDDKSQYRKQPDGKRYLVGYRLDTRHLDGFSDVVYETEQIILNALA
jgi:hypothetical protein